MIDPNENARILMGCISENINVGYQLLNEFVKTDEYLKKLPRCLERIVYQHWRTNDIFKLNIYTLYDLAVTTDPNETRLLLEADLKKYKLPKVDTKDFYVKTFAMPFKSDKQNLYAALALQFMYSEYAI